METYRLESAFSHHDRARRAAEAARRSAPGVQVSVGRSRDRRAVLRGEMRDELESMVAGPGNVGPFTRGMTRGMARWIPVGAVLGAVAGLIMLLLPWGEGMNVWLRAVIAAVAGGAAGATAGFVAGGFSRPERTDEGDSMVAERTVIVGVRAPDEAALKRVQAALVRFHPERMYLVDEEGRPAGPSSEEERNVLREP